MNVAFGRYAETRFSAADLFVDPLVVRVDRQIRVGSQFDMPITKMFGVAALVTGRLDTEWIQASRKFSLFALLFLAIAAAAVWSSVVLKWIAGPVTTIPAMTAVWGIVNRRIFAIYLACGLFGAMILGFIANIFL